ncbi:MAG: 23S rRNA (pseudouridine(1915)-N(3))-methyltransferase RlmH [Polyangiales bacterium]
MRVRIIAVGKLKEAHYRSAVDEYLKRLKHYAEASEIEVREGDASAIVKAIPARTQLVLLTIDGKLRSSEELAEYVEAVALRAQDLAFVIGGADGIPKEVLALPADRLSLGRMTLPHRLARLVLVEQIYRAMTIRKGEPYHHGG